MWERMDTLNINLSDNSLEDGLYELRVIFSGDQTRVIYAYMFKPALRLNNLTE